MNVQYDTDFEKVCELDELTIGRPALAEVCLLYTSRCV